MSHFSCPIIEITGFGRVPNSDNLCITEMCGYPVIFRTGTFQVGDRAVFIPEEGFLPEKPLFSYVWNNKEKPSDSDRVVKAKRLRGTFSCGLIIPVPDECKDLPLGTDLSNTLGITKYEQPEKITMGGDNESRPGWFPIFTEIESLRKYHQEFQIGEKVVATEKIHGCCSSFAFVDGRLWISSHKNVKKIGGKDCWNFVAKKYDLVSRLASVPNKIIFGETYGSTQRGFGYDSPKEPSFVVFDVYDINERRYLDFEIARDLATEIGLRFVPVVYFGEWKGIEHLKPFAEGKTILGNGAHIREGLIVKPYKERWSNNIGRVVLKLVGEEYLLRKGQKNGGKKS